MVITQISEQPSPVSMTFDIAINKTEQTIRKSPNKSSLISESPSDPGKIIPSYQQIEMEELEEIFSKLWVDRHGDVPNSNMTTTSLELLVEPGVLYEYDRDRGILQVSETRHSSLSSDLSKIRVFHSRNTPPPSLKYATFIGLWDDTPGTPDFTNILGGNDYDNIPTVTYFPC